MRWYGFMIIALALLAVFFIIQDPSVTEQIPTGLAVEDSSVKEQTFTRTYDIYVIGNEFIPNTYEANAGDIVSLTFVRTGVYDEIDFQIPVLNIVERVAAGDEISFTVPNDGTYDFFCERCGPQMQGSILVHE